MTTERTDRIHEAAAVIGLAAILAFLLCGCCTRRPVARTLPDPVKCPTDGTYRPECEQAIREGRPIVTDADFPPPAPVAPPVAPLPLVDECAGGT